MKYLRYITLFFICIASFMVSKYIGPISDLPNTFVVNEAYVELITKQYWFMAFLCAIVAEIMRRLFKLPVVGASVVVTLAGVAVGLLLSAGDPGSWNYVISAVTEIMWPLAVAWSVILIALYALTSYLKKVKNA